MRTKKHSRPQLAIRMQMKPRPIFIDLCTCAKNLYNRATYEVRQEFFQTGKWLQYTALYHRLKHEPVYLALKAISDSYLPQQVLRQIEQVWRSFFNAIKAWKTDPTKFHAQPRIPRYKPKTGLHMLSFPRPRVRIRNKQILFARNLMARGFPTFPVGTLPLTAETCVGARLVPFYDRFVVELIYEVQVHLFPVTDLPSRAMGIDLGLTNLVTTSDGFLVKGGVVKTINQWYNKRLAHYRALATTCNHQLTTRRILRLHRGRTNKLREVFHQTSRRLITYCVTHNIDTLVIGYNVNWKQHINLGKRTNQAFVQLPFLQFIQMLEYKANLVGMTVIRVDEAYTSQQCSRCGYIDKKNRESRGLFCCLRCGIQLNADYNAACNILHRIRSNPQVVPTESTQSFGPHLPDSGCVTYPVQNS
ncbi:MAG: RNA-guided endonuclease InsQ/TnpB family protein [Candidatus Hodarchaeales archaeon]|jgi:putative transposase